MRPPKEGLSWLLDERPERGEKTTKVPFPVRGVAELPMPDCAGDELIPLQIPSIQARLEVSIHVGDIVCDVT